LAHALAAYELMGADDQLDNARALLAWITRTGAATFTRRDAFNALRSKRFPKVTDLDPALTLLADHGHIRPAPTTPSSRGGRPSPTSQAPPDTRPQTPQTPHTPYPRPRFCGFRGFCGAPTPQTGAPPCPADAPTAGNTTPTGSSPTPTPAN